MKIRISTLPDKTRMQTLQPYFDKGRYRITVLVTTRTFGCQRGIVDVPPHKKGNLDQIWESVHFALVKTMCQYKHCSFDNVSNVKNELVIDGGDLIKFTAKSSLRSSRSG